MISVQCQTSNKCFKYSIQFTHTMHLIIFRVFVKKIDSNVIDRLIYNFLLLNLEIKHFLFLVLKGFPCWKLLSLNMVDAFPNSLKKTDRCWHYSGGSNTVQFHYLSPKINVNSLLVCQDHIAQLLLYEVENLRGPLNLEMFQLDLANTKSGNYRKYVPLNLCNCLWCTKSTIQEKLIEFRCFWV